MLAFFTGFFGDFILQEGAKMGMGGSSNWGLKKYFEQHGANESLFIAGGMLTLFFSVYVLLGFPLTYINISIYGIIIDLLFRQFRIFHSLDGYYKYFNYVESAVWIAIPMCIPLLLQRIS